MAVRMGIIASLALSMWLSVTPASAQSTLIVAGYGGSTETIIREKILPAFEKANDVKVTYVAGNLTDTLAKLQAQRGNQEIDVAMIGDGPMSWAARFGLCAPVQGIDRTKFQDVANAFGERPPAWASSPQG